jgi:hypothetical protein
MAQIDLQNAMAARTLLIREGKSKVKECKLVSLRPQKGYPIADLDHVPHRNIYHYHNPLIRGMSTVTEKMADSVPFDFSAHISQITTLMYTIFGRHVVLWVL